MATQAIIRAEETAKAISVLIEYTNLARRQKAELVVAVATHALRTAKNRADVCRTLRQETGLKVRILTEREEAKAGFMGALSNKNMNIQSCVLDIGGGSTELTLGRSDRIIDFTSVALGAVGLTERFLHRDPPLPSEWDEMNRFIESILTETFVHLLKEGKQFIGVGGTVTTLAALDLGLQNYDSNRVDGHILHRDRIRQIMIKLQRMPVAKRQTLMHFDPHRADIILGGTGILRSVMIMGNYESIIVSDRGLRFGIAVQKLREFPVLTE